MLNAGAKGYLLKDCAFEELARAIRTVFAGKTYLSPRSAERSRDSGLKGDKPDKFGLGNAGSTTLEARDESG
jgi:DNA-binding NarL/FixJ family response regulator